ncbi:hypothetical protein ACSBR2_001158 [Camellia fascicularis]
MSVEELVVRLRIEEDNRKKRGSTSSVKANVIEHGKSSGIRKKPPVNKSSKLGPRGGVAKKSAYKPQEPGYRFFGKCYNCGKEGHQASDCRKQKQPYKTKPRAHMADLQEHSHDEDDMHLFAVVSEVNLVGSNPREWWIDTGATRHICSEQKLFTTFEPVTNDEKLFIGNSATSIAERKNRTLKEMMNAMLISSGLPQNLWGEAMLSANYILNKVPRKKVDKTPYEL